MHSLAPGAVWNGNGTRSLGCARIKEAEKRRKYTKLSSLRCYEQLPFVVETCGGFGPSADVLVKDMAEASEEHLHMWSRNAVIRQLVGSVAVAVQRGSAVAYLDGFEKTLRAIRAAAEEGGERGRSGGCVSCRRVRLTMVELDSVWWSGGRWWIMRGSVVVMTQCVAGGAR